MGPKTITMMTSHSPISYSSGTRSVSADNVLGLSEFP